MSAQRPRSLAAARIVCRFDVSFQPRRNPIDRDVGGTTEVALSLGKSEDELKQLII